MDIKNSRILIDIPPDLLRAVEDYRYSKRVPSRAEAIRQLLELGLEASGSGGKRQTYDIGPAPKKPQQA